MNYMRDITVVSHEYKTIQNVQSKSHFIKWTPPPGGSPPIKKWFCELFYGMQDRGVP